MADFLTPAEFNIKYPCNDMGDSLQAWHRIFSKWRNAGTEGIPRGYYEPIPSGANVTFRYYEPLVVRRIRRDRDTHAFCARLWMHHADLLTTVIKTTTIELPSKVSQTA